MNTAIVSPSGAYAGLGFAIPVDVINRIVPQIIRGEPIAKPGLGITLVPDNIVQRLGLEGVLFYEVASGSAAEKAGLRPTTQDAQGQIVLGDLIVGAGGKPVRNSNDLLKVLDNHEIGDALELTVVRDDRKVELKVTLQSVR